MASVISNLKSIIASSNQTADQLKQVIPVLQDIIVLMSQVADIWDSIDDSLTSIQQEYSLWFVHWLADWEVKWLTDLQE